MLCMFSMIMFFFVFFLTNQWFQMTFCPSHSKWLLTRYIAALPVIHWNENVILTKFSSLAVLEVVILTTSSAANDENFIRMKTFSFWCTHNILLILKHTNTLLFAGSQNDTDGVKVPGKGKYYPIHIPYNYIRYSISQEICTRFCCALLCCGYAIVHNEFTWSIYPYSSGLLCWHWGNR